VCKVVGELASADVGAMNEIALFLASEGSVIVAASILTGTALTGVAKIISAYYEGRAALTWAQRRSADGEG